MNRLFEALSHMEMDQPSPNSVPRDLAPHDVIQLSVHAVVAALSMSAQEAVTEQLFPEAVAPDLPPSDVALSMSAQEAVTEQLFPEAVAPDVPASDVALTKSAQETVTEQLFPEAVAPDVPPSDVALTMSAQETVTEQLFPEAVAPDVPPSDVVLSMSAQEAVMEQLFPEAVAPDVPPSDVALSMSAQETVTEQLFPEAVAPDVPASDVVLTKSAQEAVMEQLFPEAVVPDVPPSDVALSMSAQEAVTEQLFPEAVAPDVPASDVALTKSAQETVTEQVFPEAVAPDVPPSDVALSMSAQETVTEQLFPEAVAPDVPPSSVTLPDRADVSTAPSGTTQYVLVAKDSQTKSAKSTAARRVPIKVLAESRLVALTDPDSLGAEKFRALVTRLEHLQKQCDLKCFQVTSSVINEGKTLVSGNVAVTLARHTGAKTLLIEGDLHRPTLGTIFGLNNVRGLSHWWSGRDQELAQFVHRLDDLPLWFLSAGKPCDRPSDILRSARFVNAFAQLASQFEWIVVDSTPMLPIVDVNLWSRLVDGTLLVVREGVTPVKALKEGLRALDHPNLIGVVLNEASATDGMKYDGQYYGSRKYGSRKRK